MNCLSYSKPRKKTFTPLFIYILSILSLLVFLFGFFPLKYSSRVNENRYNEGKKNVQRRYVDKLALIVIDALRYDFVMPANGQKYMPFTVESILNNQACYMVNKAHSPTVTLPRLKAITSGSVSSYIDVMLNFMTSAFEEENFIETAVNNGLKLVFYGDDTWLKLFPNSFIRSEGTNSFFPYDYFEVDKNVTRHIADELKKNDWDIIILHYLGLDHIGHTEGPNSPLVKTKLLEMDGIVKMFSQHFEKLQKGTDLRTMLIVTGDHGMKDSGSHGGVTDPEVTVPLVSLGNPCASLPGWPEDHVPFQIDLAPTLSTLFGLPIPVNSMGKIIPSLLYNMSREEIFQHLEVNRVQLSKFKSISDDGTDFLESKLKRWLSNNKNEDIGKNIANKYFHNLNRISQELVSTNSDFKMFFLLSGVASLWLFLGLLLHELTKQCPRPRRRVHWFLIVGTVLHALSLLSSSFIEEEHQTWYFLWATFCVFSILEVLDLNKKVSSFTRVRYLIPWTILVGMHRIFRKLNQTGDKWALLPDIKFYLQSEDGQKWLFVLFLLGVGAVFWCAVLEKCPISQLLTYGMTLIAVIMYRIATANFKLQYLVYPSSRGLSEAFVFWVFFTIFTLQSAYNQTPFYLVWIALTSLLLRPHNVILLSVQVFTSRGLYKLFPRPEDVFWNSLAHVWLGNVFYFYQGNGNSLSNIDVAAGFIGVKTYKPAYAGTMIACHTYSSHVLAFLLSPKLDLPFAVSRLIPLTVYCTVLMVLLHHLFIWSVFSPKLLYDSSTSVLLLMLLVFNNLFDLLKSTVR